MFWCAKDLSIKAIRFSCFDCCNFFIIKNACSSSVRHSASSTHSIS